MPKHFWGSALLVCGAMLSFAADSGSQANAQGPTTSPFAYGDACDDCDDCRYTHCQSFCHKIKMHCVYSHRKCTRPFVRMNGVPPELAPYIGPGTYNSPGYGVPYQGGNGVNSSCYGYPQAPSQGYTR